MNRGENHELKIGNKVYTYDKDEKGSDYISVNEKLGDNNIKIILKGGNQKTIEDVEKLVTDVLGSLYIQRNLEKLI